MSSPTTAQYHRRMARSISSRASTPSSIDDGDDAITPVAATPNEESEFETQQTHGTLAEQTVESPQSPSRRSSVSDRLEACREWTRCFDPVEGVEMDTGHLWKRMLALQKRFRCYNSARMTAALENEHVMAVVPSRACLDLLNDSISSKLPEEARKQMADFLEQRDAKASSRRKSLRSRHFF